MAKVTVTETAIEVNIASPFYTGLLSAMPNEAKDKFKSEKPEIYKMVFAEVDP